MTEGLKNARPVSGLQPIRSGSGKRICRKTCVPLFAKLLFSPFRFIINSSDTCPPKTWTVFNWMAWNMASHAGQTAKTFLSFKKWQDQQRQHNLSGPKERLSQTSKNRSWQVARDWSVYYASTPGLRAFHKKSGTVAGIPKNLKQSGKRGIYSGNSICDPPFGMAPSFKRKTIIETCARPVYDVLQVDPLVPDKRQNPVNFMSSASHQHILTRAPNGNLP